MVTDQSSLVNDHWSGGASTLSAPTTSGDHGRRSAKRPGRRAQASTAPWRGRSRSRTRLDPGWMPRIGRTCPGGAGRTMVTGRPRESAAARAQSRGQRQAAPRRQVVRRRWTVPPLHLHHCAASVLCCSVVLGSKLSSNSTCSGACKLE
jgi:hypothetical protein